MAVALEGVDLVAILVCLVAIALLTLLLLALKPVFSVVNATVGRIPGLGGITHSVEQSVIDALQDAINGTADVATRLWNGLEWMTKLMGEALHSLAVLTHQALDYLAHVGVHETIKAFLRPVADDATYARTQVDAVGAEVVDLTNYAIDKVTALEHSIAVDVPAAITVATDAVGAGLGDVISEVEHFLLGQIHTVEHDAQAIESQLADAIGKLAGKIPFEQIALLLAAVPALSLLVNTIAAESGLSNAECRAKVKGICGTDPLKWAQLLLGLELVTAMPTLEEMVTFAGGLVSELETAIVQVAGVG